MNYLSFPCVAMSVFLIVLYYSVPRKWNIRQYVLLIGSIIFYFSLSERNIIFLFVTAMSTFGSARILEKTDKKKIKKIIFIGCVILNVGMWLFTKCIIGNHLLSFEMKTENIVAPVGISYFTLQAISYLADVYHEKIAAEKCIARYMLFLCYFPAIIQGPISRYEELMPQLLNQERISFENIRKGLLMGAIGIVKKIVIADRLKIFVDECFQSYSSLSGPILYIAAVCYSIQIYTDFSGCVDVCYGISLMFNIKLIKNFNRPYLATSIKDFWNRWHISLSRWLKDYIYIPLGGNRKGLRKKSLNILVTFVVSGIWHGGRLNFLFWGLLHALYEIIGQNLSSLKNRICQTVGIKQYSRSEHIYQIILTFNLVTIAWIFFRAQSLTEGMQYFFRMVSSFHISGKIFELGVNFPLAVVMIANIISLFGVEIFTSSQDDAVEGILNSHIIIRWVIYLALVFDIVLFGVYGRGYDLVGFLYGEF